MLLPARSEKPPGGIYFSININLEVLRIKATDRDVSLCQVPHQPTMKIVPLSPHT